MTNSLLAVVCNKKDPVTMKQRGNFWAKKKSGHLRPLNVFEDFIPFFVYYVFDMPDGHVDFLTQWLKAYPIQKPPFQNMPVFLVETVFIYKMFQF